VRPPQEIGRSEESAVTEYPSGVQVVMPGPVWYVHLRPALARDSIARWEREARVSCKSFLSSR